MITKRCNTVPRYFKIIFCNMEYSILLMTVYVYVCIKYKRKSFIYIELN